MKQSLQLESVNMDMYTEKIKFLRNTLLIVVPMEVHRLRWLPVRGSSAMDIIESANPLAILGKIV